MLLQVRWVNIIEIDDDTNFLKPNGQSRNLNVYGQYSEINKG